MTESGQDLSTRRWRPEPWWLAVGCVAGIVWGAVLGILWILVGVVLTTGYDGTEVFGYLAIAAMFGAVLGGIAGLAVGVVLMLAVGRDLSTAAARPRAAAVGLLAGVVCGLGVLTVMTGDLWGEAPETVLAVGAFAGVTAAATAWWFTPKMAGRPRLAGRS